MPGAWGDYPSRGSGGGESLCPSPGQRARLALIENHYRSDALVAEVSRSSRATVAHVRRLLEEDGTIGLIEHTDRTARTRTPCADPWPFIPPMPPQPPELRDGLCVSHPRGPRMWESTRNPTDRSAALAICAVCPALAPCREWALSLSPFLDRNIGIVGGLLVADRDRIRRERRKAAEQDRAARAATPRRRRARRAARPAGKDAAP